MENRSDDVAHRRVRGFIKLILAAMVAGPPAVNASIGNMAYTSDTTSKISMPFQKSATDSILELIYDGTFELKAWPGRDADRYGRKLRVLVRDSQSLGDILVLEGLARTWSDRRESWC